MIWAFSFGLIKLLAVLFRFVMANAKDFLQGCDPPIRFLYTIFQQSSHAIFTRNTAYCLGRLPVEGHLADGSIHFQQLEDAEPAAVTGVVAMVAAFPAQECSLGCH